MSASTPDTFVLRYPVHAIDGEELIPAGVPVTAERLAELAQRGRRRNDPYRNLLQHGSVLQDTVGYLSEGPYQAIFENCRRFHALMRMMEKVALPVPLLRALDGFRADDPFTYRHILCVFALSTLLAQELIGERPEVLEGAMAGPLHDFGKTCVPLSILRKRSPLTRAERDRLRHHTEAGFVLLVYHFGDSGAAAARVARHHHERRDGSGYPLGIPLRDRMVEIVAACDVYDALISPRPYRPASFDNRTALEEMTRLVEKGKIGSDIVQALVASNRADRPDYRDCVLSLEKRGTAPAGNVYGITAEEAPSSARDEAGSPADPA